MTTERTLDPIDLQILDQLQANARETQADIARAVGLAPSAVLERVRKLEARGVIRGYGAHVNPKSLGLGLLAFVAVRSDESSVDQSIARALSDCAEVLEVHHVAGDDCYLIKVRARDAEHLGQLLRTRFGRIPGVRSTRTTIVLETVKETSRLPVTAPVTAREGVGVVSPAAMRQRKLAYAAWVSVCILWGTTYLGIRISLETMPPALMGGLRWTAAGGLLALWVLLRGEKLPPPSRWGPIALLGFLMLVLGNGGVVFAEQWVPSGLTAVLVATSPFWMAGIEAFLPDGEKLRPAVVGGLVLGFSGIVLLVWPELTLGSSGHRGFLAGIFAVQIAACGWSLGSSYSKRQKTGDNILGATALQMLAGGLMMTVIGTARGEWSALHFSTRSALALSYLTTFGALGGFVAYSYALRHLPVSFVSLYAYINPIIAVALGVLLLHEPFTARMAVAAVLVFAGVAVVRWNRQAVAPATAAKATVERSTARRQIA